MSEKLVLDVTIEIPKGSNVKYEFNRKTKQISVDRILFGPSYYPQNYGFIPEALDWDGDELDVLVFADQSFQPGIVVPTKIIGALAMIDGGETDTKLIGVIACDPRYKHVESMKDLSQHEFAIIKEFFETYKNLQGKRVEVNGFQDHDWAVKEYHECCKLMKEYGNVDKNVFITKMKKLHPNKYK
ncbi:MAG: inorganic diphosphatase [Mycoplasmoidaceae bacterium]|nr:MAG: inorganic diphosphatase [Mycoplasmoidaceae bacterium]